MNEPAIGEIPEITDPTGVVLPLDAFAHRPEDYHDVQLAAWQLIRDCVARFGSSYTVAKPTVDAASLSSLAISNERRYGPADAESAAVNGYRPSAEALGSGTKGGGWSPSQQELVLVRGTSDQPRPTDVDGDPLPDGGCLAEANRFLGSDAPTDQVSYSLPSLLGVEAHELAEGDSRVRSAIGEWSGCMDRSGYSYETVSDPINQDWPTPVGNDEVDTATADVLCKHEVNLVGIWSTVEAAYQARIIQQHQADLDALRDSLETELASAARVLGKD